MILVKTIFDPFSSCKCRENIKFLLLPYYYVILFYSEKGMWNPHVLPVGVFLGLLVITVIIISSAWYKIRKSLKGRVKHSTNTQHFLRKSSSLFY